jgi:hypothetical protein
MSENQNTAALEARIVELEQEQDRLRDDALAEAQLEQWEGRVDDLDVQLHLGGMELRDRLGPIVESIRDQLAETRAHVTDGASSASEAASTIRDGIEKAWSDLRAALLEAKKTVAG